MGERAFVRGIVAAVALGVSAVAIAQGGARPATGGPGGGGPMAGGGVAGMGEARWLERHASDPGLDEKTVAAIRSIAEEARGSASRRMEQMRVEGRKLTEMLAQDMPDEAALAKQA